MKVAGDHHFPEVADYYQKLNLFTRDNLKVLGGRIDMRFDEHLVGGRAKFKKIPGKLIPRLGNTETRATPYAGMG
jgi:hypothetical protein